MTISAFGVEHGVTLAKSSKKDKQESAYSAMKTSGAGLAGLGLIGGGIPGYKSNYSTIKDMRSGDLSQRAGAAMSSLRGGIFGYRTDAHKKFSDKLKSEHQPLDNETKGQAYRSSHQLGKLKAEKAVIPQMKKGRLISHAALGTGLATMYGAKKYREKNKIRKSDKDFNRYNGALLGGGATAYAGASIADKVLRGQSKKWNEVARGNSKRAQNLSTERRLVNTIKPDDQDFGRPDNKSYFFEDKPKANAKKAGKLMGEATQAKYFSNTYRTNAKVFRSLKAPAAAVAAIGGSQLYLKHRKDKR